MNKTLIKLHQKANEINKRDRYKGLTFHAVMDILIEGWDFACEEFDHKGYAIKEEGRRRHKELEKRRENNEKRA